MHIYSISKLYLLRLQITDDCVYSIQNFLNEWHYFSHLNLHKMPSTLLCDLDKSVTSHILYTIMCFC